MQLLRGAVYALEMACAKGRLADLAITPGFEDISSEMQIILLRALALAAAACAGSSEALAHMPVWGPCSGECPCCRRVSLQSTRRTLLRACSVFDVIALPQAPAWRGARSTLLPGGRSATR